METLVLRACIHGLIKTLCFLDYWCPGEISWFLRLPGKVPDVGCCNQPLPETQSLLEETVSKYHKCVLKPQKAVQPSWKWMFTRRNDERVCAIYRGINVSWLWTWTARKTMKVLQTVKIPSKSEDWKAEFSDLQSRLFLHFRREDQIWFIQPMFILFFWPCCL